MSPAEKAARLRAMKCSRERPSCVAPEHCAALEAGAEAIEAAKALREILTRLSTAADYGFDDDVRNPVWDDERAAARRLLAAIGGES